MKTLILITISIISLNVFSSEVGEVKKSECLFAAQTSKRESKVVEVVKSEPVKQTTKVMSK